MTTDGLEHDAGREPGHLRTRMGLPGYLPDHAEERREEFLRSTPGERLVEAIALSRLATRFAAAGAAARERR